MISEKIRRDFLEMIVENSNVLKVDGAVPCNERFWHNKWRPAIGWSYMIVCLFDFIFAPIIFSILHLLFIENVTNVVIWEPITLKGGGLYHIAMLTIVGVTAYGRTKEKIEGVTTVLSNQEKEILEALRTIIENKQTNRKTRKQVELE